MGKVVQIATRFKKPIKNRKNLYYKEKGKKSTSKRRAMVKQPIFLPKSKYINLFLKAKAECRTAAPVHDILELLLQYYLENEFIVNRRMVLVNDPTVTQASLGKRKRQYQAVHTQDKEPSVRLWLMLTKATNTLLINRVKRQGVSKSFVFNLLVDFYMDNQFLIKTKIIRVNRYRTGNPKKDVKLLENREDERKFLTKHHDRFI